MLGSGTHELYRDLLYPGGVPNGLPALGVFGHLARAVVFTLMRQNQGIFAAETGVMHERTASPLKCTVQAPHWARPQPKRGPSRRSSFRRT